MSHMTDTENVSFNGGILSNPEPQKLRDVLQHLRESYCGYIGWDINHIGERKRLIFMREKAENFKEFKNS